MLHDDDITALAISPSGEYLASTSSDKTLRIWHIKDGTEYLRVPTEGVARVIMYSPDNQYLAFSRCDNYSVPFCEESLAYLLNAQNGEKISSISHSGVISSIRFSQDSKYLLLENAFKSKQFDIENNVELSDSQYNGSIFQPFDNLTVDGRYEISTFNFSSNSVQLWDTESEKEILRIIHEFKLTGVIFSTR